MAGFDQFLKVFITADGRGLSAGLLKALGEIKGFISTAERAFSGLKGLFASLGVTIGTGAFILGIKRTIDGFDELSKASQKVGVTTEALSALAYAADLSGSSMEGLQTGLKFLNKNLQEAKEGNRDLSKTFADLGVSLGSTTEEAVLALADAFAAMPDGAEKTNKAMKLLGRSGAELIPLLNSGRAGLEQFRKEAERLGIVVAGPTAKAAEAFNDNMERAGKSISAVGISIANSALPGLNSLAGAMDEAATKGEGLSGIIKNLGQEIFNLMRYGTSQGARKEGFVKELDQQEKILQGQIERRRELQAQYDAASYTSLFGNKAMVGQRLGFVDENIAKTEQEIQRLYKELQAFPAAADGTANALNNMSAALYRQKQLAAEAADTLAALPGQYKKLVAEIKAANDAVKAGAQKKVEDSTVLDINRLREQAKGALEKGDAEAAQKLIKQAVAINDYLIENQKISKTYYQTQADMLLELAREGQALADSQPINIALGYDPAQIQGVATIAWDTAQATINAKGPIVIPGVMQIGAADFTNVTADGRTLVSAAGITGKAAGGLISGPGTGISDSILARLSAGEFVVRAAAVKSYGLGFLERLNSMALPRFAAGGPVGTPVHLHIDGSSYPMTAAPSVAKQLGRILGTEVLKRGRR